MAGTKGKVLENEWGGNDISVHIVLYYRDQCVQCVRILLELVVIKLDL